MEKLLDVYKLRSKDFDSTIRVREHIFYLLNGIPEGDERDMELRVIHDKLDCEHWYKEPSKIIQKPQNRDARLPMLKGVAPDVSPILSNPALDRMFLLGDMHLVWDIWAPIRDLVPTYETLKPPW
jgi:hypothetical protein